MKRIFEDAIALGLPEPQVTEIATGVRLTAYLHEAVPVQAKSISEPDPISRAQSRAQSGAQSEDILQLLAARILSANALADALGLQSKTGAFKRSIKDLINSGLITYTLPNKPSSRLQQYRLTESGKAYLQHHGRAGRNRDKNQGT